MRISAVAFLMILTTVFLSACSQQRTMASVDNRGAYYYGRGAAPQYAAAYAAPVVAAAPVAPVISAAPVAPAPVAVAVPAPAPAPAPAQAQAPTTAAATPIPAVMPKQPLEQVNTGTTPAATPDPKMTEEGMMAYNGAWQWPVQGKVIQQFGSQQDGSNSEGITIAAAEGSPIHAAQSGEVAYVGHNVRDYGNMVILRHADGTLTSYSHAREITVKKGDKVEIGSVIGTVGNTGGAATPQLHFALREDGHAVDPLVKLPQSVASNLI